MTLRNQNPAPCHLLLGLRDSGKENGNYCSMMGYVLGFNKDNMYIYIYI